MKAATFYSSNKLKEVNRKNRLISLSNLFLSLNLLTSIKFQQIHIVRNKFVKGKKYVYGIV